MHWPALVCGTLYALAFGAPGCTSPATVVVGGGQHGPRGPLAVMRARLQAAASWHSCVLCTADGFPQHQAALHAAVRLPSTKPWPAACLLTWFATGGRQSGRAEIRHQLQPAVRQWGAPKLAGPPGPATGTVTINWRGNSMPSNPGSDMYQGQERAGARARVCQEGPHMRAQPGASADAELASHGWDGCAA